MLVKGGPRRQAINSSDDDPFHWRPLALPGVSILTHWGWDKMATISQTILSIAFSWNKILEFSFKFHWNLFPRLQSMIFHHWFRYAWRRIGDKPWSEPMVAYVSTCVTRPQWVILSNDGSLHWLPLTLPGISVLNGMSYGQISFRFIQ